MTDQILKAFSKQGQIILTRDDLQGAYELASAPDQVLAQVIDATADMSEDKLRYFVPGYLETDDDRVAAECVMDYQIELNQHLRRVLSSFTGSQDHVSAALAN
jgi:hypothetical protein